jgi:hypothetical protein
VGFCISIQIEYMELLSQYNHKLTYGLVVKSLISMAEVPVRIPLASNFWMWEGGDGADGREGERGDGAGLVGGKKGTNN